MNTDFTDQMSNHTDEELIKIVTVDRDGYQPLAVEAAEEEIRKRNITATTVDQVKTDLTIKVEQQKMFYTNRPSSITRLIHFIVDSIAWLTIVAVLTWPLNARDGGQMLIGYLILFLSFFGYYSFMEMKYQKTIGKFITKTRVVNSDGSLPQIGDIVRRTFCRLIPFDSVSFLFTANGFHDRLSDTMIIKDENLQ